MHQQIKASPETTAENIRTIVDALAAAEINIEAIAPDFDPPHVRVLVKHNHPYKPDDMDDTFNQALAALREVGLEPQTVRSMEPVRMPNVPRALKTAMDVLESQGHTIESILVLPAAQGNQALVSFGLAGEVTDDWQAEAEQLQATVEAELGNLQ